MKNFLNGQTFYLKKDTTFRSICFIFLIGSIALLVLTGSKGGWDISSPMKPLSMAASFSLFLYFVIPMQACFFSTEGFEYGSVKNIIASGQSRTSYFMGKFLSEIKVIIWCVLQFTGVFYVLYMMVTLILGAHIGDNSLRQDAIAGFTALGFNMMYLAAYSAIVMMVGMIVRKTASAILITFVIIFGDFLLSGYLRDSSSTFLRMVSNNTLMTQIMKFSGMYVKDSERVLITSMNDYVHVGLIPMIIIAICLTVTVISFEKRDIHT
ncbi:hypothetical protein [Paenibacillus segetis]|uniref:ABC transporter permease n=1 Tax=Paenibacillus segetis TaxID=1325360 RepID=A0ABQ1Y7Q6_9BACL|nr:hypothetical protein [Paenibacillus segetis]GGH15615.1 hypothetical protein GCM10008013_09940 [Paenibacillus segetis]